MIVEIKEYVLEENAFVNPVLQEKIVVRYRLNLIVVKIIAIEMEFAKWKNVFVIQVFQEKIVKLKINLHAL
jgi:hypothetical protein